MPSYISLTITNDKIVVIAKTEDDLRRFLEALKKYGVYGVSVEGVYSSRSLCG